MQFAQVIVRVEPVCLSVDSGELWAASAEASELTRAGKSHQQ